MRQLNAQLIPGCERHFQAIDSSLNVRFINQRGKDQGEYLKRSFQKLQHQDWSAQSPAAINSRPPPTSPRPPPSPTTTQSAPTPP